MARSTSTLCSIGVGLLLLQLSGALTGSALAAWETFSDRPGSDYTSFPIAKEVEAFVAVKQCEDACKNETQCKAFTYVKPGVLGPEARCFLKNAVPTRVQNECCTSGVVRPQSKADYCNNYALDAQLAAKNNVNYQCGQTGNRWADNYKLHYDWCMGVSEADSKSEAAARKSQLDQCQKPSTSGDLAAFDVCYWINGNQVSFYPVVKNVGSSHWRSTKTGEYVMGSSAGPVQTEGRRQLPASPYWDLGVQKTSRLQAMTEPYHPDNHYRFGWLLRHSEDGNPGNNDMVKKPFDTFSGKLSGSRLEHHPWLLANKACTRVPIKHQPLNLYWTGTDLNGIPLNPAWGWQLEHAYGSSNYYPDVAWLTPLLQIRNFYFMGYSVKKLGEERDFSKATDQQTFKEYGGNYIPGAVDIPVPGVCGPHVNWKTPVTYEGQLNWDSYDSNDGDLNFYLFPDQGYGAVKKGSNHGGIKVEFDSDETVDHFNTPWWSQKGDDFTGVDNMYAIVTGLWGFDCAHECASELHPAWTMAIRVQDQDPKDEVWAIFARNWGNEGFCSDHVFTTTYPKQGNQHIYKFLLPWRPGAVSVAVDPKTKFLQKGGVGMGVTPLSNQGVVVAFSLPEPGQRPRINGELHLKWTYPDGVPAKPHPVSQTASANAASAAGLPISEDSAMVQRIMQALPPEKAALYGQILDQANLKDAQLVPDLEPPMALAVGDSLVRPDRVPQVEMRPDTYKLQRKRDALQRLEVEPQLYKQMQPQIEEVTVIPLKLATGIAPLEGGAVQGGGVQDGGVQGGREEACRRYADSAVAQQSQNAELGCGFQGPEWNSDHQAHLSWCLHGENLRFTEGGTRAREEALERCRAESSGGGAADACRRYAESAVAQQSQNVERGCGFQGPKWNPDYQAHLSWCLHGENVRYAEGESRARDEALANCRGGSAGGTEEACRRYAESAVAQQSQNVELGCGFQGPRWNPDYQAHLTWCLHGENVRFAEGESRARDEALANCRRR